ncbi:MAG: asparagine synthase (glutamine-hydrolyzing) [Gammaproteobacteria bacterium]
MCGITGAVSLGASLDHHRFKTMVDSIAHRGPDDAGYLVWRSGRAGGDRGAKAFTDRRFRSVMPHLPAIDTPEGERTLAEPGWDVFLGHRRLAIIDTGPGGHQPMRGATPDLWVVYNGEIYNSPELRSELQALGRVFTSRSDTEVLLAAYEAWGIECIERLNGMFAFALLDARTNRLHLVRDRYGIKPLYYHSDGGRLAFGSEVKAILHSLGGFPRVDLLALDEYCTFQHVFSERTLFSGVSQLAPGTRLEVDLGTGAMSRARYWDFDFSVETGGDADAIRDELAAHIERAVRRQCLSDVPIGCYLSGGMDSGTITALAARHLGRIHTFTCGFDLSEAAQHEQAFDERATAEFMSNLFQTEHYECVLHSGDMEATLDDLVWHLEDLRVGQSYPNYCVARLASRFVKVVMSGTGGDELFGGYPWRYAAAVAPNGTDFINNYYRYWKRLVSNTDKPAFYHPDVIAAMNAFDGPDGTPLRDYSLNMFKRVFPGRVRADALADQVRSSLYFECKTFLHGLLVVEDKLSMAHSLESRVPMLDNDLIDFACRVPVTLKVSGIDHLQRLDENLLGEKKLYREQMHTGKNILRNAMATILPDRVNGARKQGFSGPDESWFRGRAAQFVRRMLLSGNSRIGAYVQLPFVEQVLAQHGAGAANHRLLIWSLVSLESWLRRFDSPGVWAAGSAAHG